MPDFIPRKDNEALTFASNFSARISADPAKYHVSVADAALLASSVADFATAVRAAQDPEARTPVAIAAKDRAREAMQGALRPIAGQLRASFNDDRLTLVELGLAIGPGRNAPRRRIGPPKSAPIVVVRDVRGRTVSLRLYNPDAPSRRGMAADIAGAIILTAFGDEHPTSLADWRMQKLTTRTDATLHIKHDAPPGARLWICAQWRNRRGQTGPISSPVSTRLGAAGPTFRAAA
jgi:hypothetical protein